MVVYGVDQLSEYARCFKGKRLGLLTSSSGRNSALRSSVDLFSETCDLRALYAPEHGIRGAMGAGDVFSSSIDEKTGVPVFSLYQKDQKRLTREMLANVDAVVYDIQDVGARFYTYLTTLLYTLEDCAAFCRELIVLDRPNPLGGTVIEGPGLSDACKSFIGCYDLPIRHGLTNGEFARMANAEQRLGCLLTVVPLKGWARDRLFCDTGNLWVTPSPSLPYFEQALIYPGTCLFEGTNVSEGWGTSNPFAMIGAPYLQGEKLCDVMNAKGLEGVLFTPAAFVPTASKYAGVPCEGVQIHVTQPPAYQAFTVGIELLYAIRELYPNDLVFNAPVCEGTPPMIDLLSGSSDIRLGKKTSAQLLAEASSYCRQYQNRAQKFYLYQ